jgi:hypothetical protein
MNKPAIFFRRPLRNVGAENAQRLRRSYDSIYALICALSGFVALGCSPRPTAVPNARPGDPIAVDAGDRRDARATGTEPPCPVFNWRTSDDVPCFEEPPRPSEPPERVERTRVETLGVASGEVNYIILYDRQRKTWQLRMVAAQLPWLDNRRRFHGRIEARPLNNVHSWKAALESRIRVSTMAVSFDIYSKRYAATLDAIEFTTEEDCVRFYLLIDGAAQPNAIVMGKTGEFPGRAYLEVCRTGP